MSQKVGQLLPEVLKISPSINAGISGNDSPKKDFWSRQKLTVLISENSKSNTSRSATSSRSLGTDLYSPPCSPKPFNDGCFEFDNKHFRPSDDSKAVALTKAAELSLGFVESLAKALAYGATVEDLSQLPKQLQNVPSFKRETAFNLLRQVLPSIDGSSSKGSLYSGEVFRSLSSTSLSGLDKLSEAGEPVESNIHKDNSFSIAWRLLTASQEKPCSPPKPALPAYKQVKLSAPGAGESNASESGGDFQASTIALPTQPKSKSLPAAVYSAPLPEIVKEEITPPVDQALYRNSLTNLSLKPEEPLFSEGFEVVQPASYSPISISQRNSMRESVKNRMNAQRLKVQPPSPMGSSVPVSPSMRVRNKVANMFTAIKHSLESSDRSHPPSPLASPLPTGRHHFDEIEKKRSKRFKLFNVFKSSKNEKQYDYGGAQTSRPDFNALRSAELAQTPRDMHDVRERGVSTARPAFKSLPDGHGGIAEVESPCSTPLIQSGYSSPLNSPLPSKVERLDTYMTSSDIGASRSMNRLLQTEPYKAEIRMSPSPREAVTRSGYDIARENVDVNVSNVAGNASARISGNGVGSGFFHTTNGTDTRRVKYAPVVMTPNTNEMGTTPRFYHGSPSDSTQSTNTLYTASAGTSPPTVHHLPPMPDAIHTLPASIQNIKLTPTPLATRTQIHAPPPTAMPQQPQSQMWRRTLSNSSNVSRMSNTAPVTNTNGEIESGGNTPTSRVSSVSPFRASSVRRFGAKVLPKVFQRNDIYKSEVNDFSSDILGNPTDSIPSSPMTAMPARLMERYTGRNNYVRQGMTNITNTSHMTHPAEQWRKRAESIARESPMSVRSTNDAPKVVQPMRRWREWESVNLNTQGSNLSTTNSRRTLLGSGVGSGEPYYESRRDVKQQIQLPGSRVSVKKLAQIFDSRSRDESPLYIRPVKRATASSTVSEAGESAY